MQLFGGIRHKLTDGSTIRGNIHILITGDPGVGKSQILKLVSGVVPRGRYVSGSGVSGAGLTATVTKNELLGSWVLEAGALILCNKGLISIDEFDKMSRDDQVAMHEATSIETVSIAKASIVATLPAQTAVLAGANPKYGRFDPYKPIAEQIQIPETLLSRFDLKFALRDIPDKTNDEMLAEHILMSRKSPEASRPAIDTALLRKYVAYAKQIEEIELTDEAAKSMKDFYVDMRGRYSGEGIKTVSITLRQYEALLRIAEASAKIRLDSKIRTEDAQRAIRLVEYSLKQLGYDTETGRIDIDMLESGIPASRRSRINRINELIDELQKESPEIAEEDLFAEAETRGIGDTEKIKEVIEQLKREGTLFEPRPGFLRKT
jgi:replicative DNA helicase Mcm